MCASRTIFRLKKATVERVTLQKNSFRALATFKCLLKLVLTGLVSYVHCYHDTVGMFEMLGRPCMLAGCIAINWDAYVLTTGWSLLPSNLVVV